MWCDVSYMSNVISVLLCHLFPMCYTYSLCPMLCACFLCHMCQMWCTCYLCHMCSMCCTFPICHKCSMLFACFLYQMCLMCRTCPLCHMCPTWCAYFLCLDWTSFYGWISSSRTGWAFRTLSGGKGWVLGHKLMLHLGLACSRIRLIFWSSKSLLSQPYTQVQGSILSIACLNIPKVTTKWGSKKSAKTAKNANFCQNWLSGPTIPPWGAGWT